MGNDMLRKEKGELDYLNVINKRFKPISLLGNGAFGYVCKAVDQKEKEFVALKISKTRKKIDGKQKENRSCENEKIILQKIGIHQNIVGYKDFFKLDYNPLKPKERDTIYDCIALEYCNGCDLSNLLKNQENLSLESSIKWLLIMLKTFEFIHEKNIVHRDIKPDNILIKFLNPQKYKKKKIDEKEVDLENIVLKVSDFGSAIDLNEIKNPKSLSGCHLFFCAPEIIETRFNKKNYYDKDVDIYSLGIVFFQTLCNLSVESYELMIKKLFSNIQTNNKEEILKKYNLNKLEECKIANYMNFIHSKNLIWNEIIVELIEDKIFLDVLKCMICTRQKRLTAKQLSDHETIKALDIIINRRRKKYKYIKDHKYIFFFLERREMISVCIDILIKNFHTNKTFLEKGGLEILFNAVEKKSEIKSLLKYLIRVMIINYFKTVDLKLIQEIANLLRKYYHISTIRTILIDENEDNLYCYFFVYLIMICNDSMLYKFSKKNIFISLIKKVNNYNSIYVLPILEIILPNLGKYSLNIFKDEILKISYVDTKIFESLFVVYEKLKKVLYNNEVSEQFFLQIKSNLEKGVYVEQNLKILLFLLYDFKTIYKIKQDLILELKQQPSKYCMLNYLVLPSKKKKLKNDDDDKYEEDEEEEEEEEENNDIGVKLENSTTFSCSMNENESIELISSESICSIQSEKLYHSTSRANVDPFRVIKKKDYNDDDAYCNRKKVIGYYETKIENGGTNDGIEYGFNILNNKNEEFKFFISTFTGKIQFFKFEKYSERISKSKSKSKKEKNFEDEKITKEIGKFILKYESKITKPIPAFTKSYIGIGILEGGIFFSTYNNELIYPFYQINSNFFISENDIDSNKGKIRINALFKIIGNEYLKASVNFGANDKLKFNYYFKNYPDRVMNKNIIENIKKNKKLFEDIISVHYLQRYKKIIKKNPDLTNNQKSKIDKLITILNYNMEENKQNKFDNVLKSKNYEFLDDYEDVGIHSKKIQQRLIKMFKNQRLIFKYLDYKKPNQMIDDLTDALFNQAEEKNKKKKKGFFNSYSQ